MAVHVIFGGKSSVPMDMILGHDHDDMKVKFHNLNLVIVLMT